MDHCDPRLTLRWRGRRPTKVDVVGVTAGVAAGDAAPSDSGSGMLDMGVVDGSVNDAQVK